MMERMETDQIKTRYLHLRQRDFLASFFEKVAVVLFTGLMVEPIISRQTKQAVEFNVWMFAGALLFVLILITYANLRYQTKATR